MKKELYTITELEKKSGLSRRTIHFYSQSGIIPPPRGTGGAAKYGEVHLLKLKLIKVLKKSHLKLSGIKEALDAMNLDEMKSLLMKSSESPSWENFSLEKWITADNIGYDNTPTDEFRIKRDSQKELFSMSDGIKANKKNEPEYQDRYYLRELKRKTAQKTSWERYTIKEGVEISFRSDIDKRDKNMIIRIIEELRDKLK